MTTAATLGTHPRDRWVPVRFSLLALTAPTEAWEKGWSYSSPDKINRQGSPVAAAFLDLLRHWTQGRIRRGAQDLWLTESMGVIQGSLYGIATSQNTIRKAIALVESRGYITVRRSDCEPLRFLLHWDKVEADIHKFFQAEQGTSDTPSKMMPPEESSDQDSRDEGAFSGAAPFTSEDLSEDLNSDHPLRDEDPPFTGELTPLKNDYKKSVYTIQKKKDLEINTKRAGARAIGEKSEEEMTSEVAVVLEPDSEPETIHPSFVTPSPKAIAVATNQPSGADQTASRRLNDRSGIQVTPIPPSGYEHLDRFGARFGGALSKPMPFATRLAEGEEPGDRLMVMTLRGERFALDGRLVLGMVSRAPHFYNAVLDRVDVEAVRSFFSKRIDSPVGRAELESYWKSGLEYCPDPIAPEALPELARAIVTRRHGSGGQRGATRKPMYSPRLGSPERAEQLVQDRGRLADIHQRAHNRHAALASAR